MPKNVTQYDLLISCPGDVENEIGIIRDVVSRFNDQFSDILGISVRTKDWRRNSFPQSGKKPQPSLNEQLVNDCDAAVVIFWTRFGTPTDEYGSGTEEEVEIMLASKKQVFMYFSKKPVDLSKVDYENYQKIQTFRERYKDRGIYWEYTSDEEFDKLFFAHLSQFFLSEKRVAEVKEERRSELKIVGIDQSKHISNETPIIKFFPNTEMTMSMYLEKIQNLYNIISATVLAKRTLPNQVYSFVTPVEIDTDDREQLQSCAEALKIRITEDFFVLGNLSKEDRSNYILELDETPRLRGTEAEKAKYDNIQKLLRIISKALQWAPVEFAFANKKCLQLALQNNGTAIDEDIEIALSIPKNSLLPRSEFPKFDNLVMEYLLNDCNMSEIFGIRSTSTYWNYEKSLVTSQRFSSPVMLPTPFGSRPNYRDNFESELDGVFYYSYFDDGDKYTVKAKFDYIKHNTIIAFPSVIFIKDPFVTMPYTITSKNSPKIVSGEIKITDCVSEVPTL